MKDEDMGMGISIVIGILTFCGTGFIITLTKGVIVGFFCGMFAGVAATVLSVFIIIAFLAWRKG